MINTASDFQSALTYVMTEPDPLTASFGGDMKAAAFNAAFQNIEDQINFLYEKTRLLEDIRDYIRNFIDKAIEERRASLVENLKAIEMIYDELDNPDCVVEPVIVQTNQQLVYDRDNTELPSFDVVNNVLIMPGTVIGNNDIVKITVKEQTQSLSDQDIVYQSAGVLEPLVQASVNIASDRQTFLDVYSNSKPTEGTVTTTYEILFAGNRVCNYVNFAAVNCDIVDITLYDTEGNVQIVNSDAVYIQPVRISKALITLKTKEYNRYFVQHPIADIMPDFFTCSVNRESDYIV